MDSLEKKVYVFMGMAEGEAQDYYSNSKLNDDDYDDSLEDDQDDVVSGNSYHHSAYTTLYWDSQEALLQETLERYNLIGWKLRGEIKEMMEVVKGSQFCSCISFKPNTASTCSHCLRKSMVTMLSHAGYNATLRISKWENTKRFPGGSHEYIEIMMGSKQPTRTKKQNPIFLVELELRDQFKMGRASEEYNKMVSMLPEFFVGKPEYLTGIIRVMCSAAKKSMKEKKIHMGPWRKSSFMQMKWSASVSAPAPASALTLTSMTSAVSFNKNKNWNLEFGKESLKITATTTTTTTNNIALSSFSLRQQIQPNCLPISEAPFVVVS